MEIPDTILLAGGGLRSMLKAPVCSIGVGILRAGYSKSNETKSPTISYASVLTTVTI